MERTARAPEALDPAAVPVAPVIRIARPEPFEAFYRRELPRLVTLARALCGSAACDDIAQEAMLAAYRRWDEVAAYDRPEAWVRRVCANLATSHVRRRTVEARALLRLSGRRDLPDLLPDNETFWAAIRRLPRRQAQAAALRYVYDLSVADVALTMGCAEGTAKVHLSRGRDALSRTLGTGPEEVS